MKTRIGDKTLKELWLLSRGTGDKNNTAVIDILESNDTYNLDWILLRV